MITLQNYPLRITPSNAPHWWSVSSNLSGSTNFKYVFDVWVNKNGWEKVARLKTRPNETGYAHVNLQEIMFNQLVPNIRAPRNAFYFLPDPLGTIPGSYEPNTIRESNYLNTDPDYNPLWHVSEYRVSLGEEYTSGSTTILDIPLSVSGETGNTQYSAYTITIYPGAQDNLLNKPFEYTKAPYVGNKGQNNWKDFNQFLYQFTTTGRTFIHDRRFLSAAGEDLVPYKINGVFSGNTRHRKHHSQCPIIVPFFSAQNGEFCGNADRVAISTGDLGAYNGTAFGTSSTFTNGCSTSDVNKRILYKVEHPNPIDQTPYKGRSLTFYAQSGTTRTSEFLTFNVQPDDCLSDPIHIIFLNKRGVWDSYTFDRKSIRRLSKKDSVYAQAPNINKSVFNQFEYEQRDVIYDYEIIEQVDAQTWYMDENDKSIIEEMFLSPYTYLFLRYKWGSEAAIIDDDEIVPIKIDTNSWSEFKNRYNKLFQYSFTFTYNPINLKLRQG
jgi:hypothetical protein